MSWDATIAPSSDWGNVGTTVDGSDAAQASKAPIDPWGIGATTDTGATKPADDPWNIGANTGPGFTTPADPWHAVAKIATNGTDQPANVSKHENGGIPGAEGGATDENCRNCGQPGHFARECSEPKQLSGACFNCGQSGHNKADCTNPRVFTGTCRICEKEGHPAAECPDRPADVCKNCKKEGHTIDECEGNRTKDWTNVPDVDGTEAWNNMEKADKDKDIDEFKNWFLAYARKTPDLTFQAMEKALRNHKLNVHLVAVQKDIDDTQTIVNLEGKTGCTHQVQFQYSLKPKRKAFAQGWPTDEEDNMTKLADAGFVEDSYKIKCRNCDMFGHTSKFCTEEKKEVERVKVKCQNCDQEGHRVRDCPEQRKEKGVCRNCNEPGHRASDCTEPRSAAGIECKRCNEMGHFAKDCPNSGGGDRACRNCGKEGHMAKECEEPRDPATVTCRNCDEVGHFSKECPKPRDYSRVKCSNCGEMGHTIKRCKQPVVGNAEGGGFGGAPGGDAMGMSGGGAGHNAFEASTTPAGW